MRVFVAVVMLASASPALAEHGDPLMIAAPTPSTPLPRNARIRIESHNGIAFPLDELARGVRGHAAALVAADHRVPLVVEGFFDDNEGGYGAGLLVLAPKRTLSASTAYQLVITTPSG